MLLDGGLRSLEGGSTEGEEGNHYVHGARSDLVIRNDVL